jgi:hypothetical protein
MIDVEFQAELKRKNINKLHESRYFQQSIVSIIAILLKLQIIIIDVPKVLLKRPCTILALFLLILRLNWGGRQSAHEELRTDSKQRGA